MSNEIFVSYRRADAQHAAFAIADRLRWAFGQEAVFLDRGSIEAGVSWPDSIRTALGAAKVGLVVIGPQWLRTADDWGRRRLDDTKDWVRCEVSHLLAAKKKRGMPVIAVYLEGAQKLPKAAFDAALRDLCDLQSRSLPNEQWDIGLEKLLGDIESGGSLERTGRPNARNANGSPARPRRRQARQKALPDEKVRRALAHLTGWQLHRGPHPWAGPDEAQEITKCYEFRSFEEAIAFMASVAPAIERWVPQHHPRWENQWKVVNVWFSTWDVNCRVTKLDIAAAKKLDALYFEFLRR